ncbi:MAG: hypothetical protein ACM33B_03075 [Pseudomonadota bacterium]
MIEERRGRAADVGDGSVELAAAGERARGEFRCCGCRYGITIAGTLPSCPMCGGERWERRPWAPFTRTELESLTRRLR